MSSRRVDTARLLVFGAVAICTVVVGSLFMPLGSIGVTPVESHRSGQQNLYRDSRPGDWGGVGHLRESTGELPESALPTLGMIESGDYRVVILLAEDGIRYNVYDHHNVLLGEEMTAEEAEAWFSDLNLTDLHAPGAIGRAETFGRQGR